MTTGIRARVSRFGGPENIDTVPFELPRPRGGAVTVRVTHASVGSTDVLARRGGYLLQPRAGFTPGYDFVGVIESGSATADRLGLHPGARVAGCLPRMRTHATHLVVDPTLLVLVPDALPSAVAATAPLDLVTAALALRLAAVPAGGRLLIQGVTGAVGSFAAQQARRAGLEVLGTASARSAAEAQNAGATPDTRYFDYADPDWPRQVRDATSVGADAAIDHTGSQTVREAVARHGTLVRTAYTGRAGRERRDTAVGGLTTVARRSGRPRELLCSVPLFIATQRNAYRRVLQTELAAIATGALTPFAADVYPFEEVRSAYERAEHPDARHKVVLELPGA
ncbi:zinc-binding alcohol dehydrogenase family protein [Leifsonia sp. NPDC058248]|uniref:quinone oxidoreductase family protein n=1 Tax=Leifsonia sp. NPDC058248 TaxID=3346402 RepID=UPI0036DCCCC2